MEQLVQKICANEEKLKCYRERKLECEEDEYSDGEYVEVKKPYEQQYLELLAAGYFDKREKTYADWYRDNYSPEYSEGTFKGIEDSQYKGRVLYQKTIAKQAYSKVDKKDIGKFARTTNTCYQQLPKHWTKKLQKDHIWVHNQIDKFIKIYNGDEDSDDDGEELQEDFDEEQNY